MARHLLAASVLAVVALGLGACSPPPDVVVITVDTLRADHLGCYGGSASTPAVDALAAGGVVFERAMAQMAETRPSHATIFTSRYPAGHGVVSNAAPMKPGLETLPRRFAEAGWATAGFAGCALFDEAAGDALGFSHFDAPKKPQRAAHEVVDPALAWLAELPEDQRFFLWLHLFDPHMPYEPPPPWNEAGSTPEDVRRLPRFAWPRLLAIAERHDGDLPADVAQRAHALYRGEVEYADHELGRFLDTLKARGRFDDTLVVFTADHGECFENGVYFDHSQCLGQGALAVPLVLHYPRHLAPGRVAPAVEHLDLAPTVLRLAGLEVPPSFAGRDLFGERPDGGLAFFQHPLYRAQDVRDRQQVLDRLRSVAGEPTRPITGDRLQVGARRGDLKYLLSGEEETLYNLADDPGEGADLSRSDPGSLLELRRRVRRFMEEHPLRLDDPGELDPELRRKLEALGYL